jgi:putative proteasome-type protease
MTFCLGMNCEQGLLALADTRITSGTETSTARKISVYESDAYSMFVLTSGLRSVRDKVMTYFEERLEQDTTQLTRMHHIANLFAEQVRLVHAEDRTWLQAAGFSFDLHCILGGQIRGEARHRLYLVYPEGNWVEVGQETPYVITGESSYGKPLLDRVWRYDSTLRQGLRDALLSFDATRTSASDVGYPVDAVVYVNGAFEMRQRRLERSDLEPLAEYWQRSIRTAADGAERLISPLFSTLVPVRHAAA